MADVKTSALTNERTAVQITDDTQIVVGVTDLGDLTQSFRCRLSAMKGTAGPYGDEIRLGGSTATEVMLKRAGTTLQLRLADDSNNASFVPGDVIVGGNATITQAGSHQLELRNALNPQSLTIYNTYTSGVNYERGFIRWVSDTFEIGTERIGGTSRSLAFRSATATTSFYYNTSSLAARLSNAKVQTQRLGLSTTVTSDEVILETSAAGVLKITNSSLDDIGRVCWGGVTSAYPALKRSATELQVRLADDTGSAPLSSGNHTIINGTTSCEQLIYNTYTSGSVYERAFMRFSAGVLHIGTEHIGGSARDVEIRAGSAIYIFQSFGRLDLAEILLSSSTPINMQSEVRISVHGQGVMRLNNNALSDYDRLQFGGGSASFPAIQRNGAGFDFILADDTGACNISCAQITIADASDVVLNTTTGTKIGTGTTQKLGFWNATPIAQPSTTGETVGFTAGSGTAVNDDSTFTGNVGTTAYRISDIVKHLKNAGLIAS